MTIRRRYDWSATGQTSDTGYGRGASIQTVSQTINIVERIAIGIALLAGILRLPEPIWGDQALFIVGARTLDAGGLLYRDFWDVKPPGIYGLYWLAGKLFGFHGIGIHLFELGWMVALAIVLRHTLSRYFYNPAIGRVFPWLMVGLYYATSDHRQLSQLECFINLPLFLLVWFALRATHQTEKRQRWLFLSGLMGGIILIFKVIFLPILVALWLVCLADFWFKRQISPIQILPQMICMIGLGCLTPIVPIVLYLSHVGTLHLAYETCFILPKQLVKQLPLSPLSRLIGNVNWFVRKYLPVLGLASLGIYQWAKRWSFTQKRLVPQGGLQLYMLTWLGIGIPVILIQSQSWWTYHFMLLLVPLSILAAKAVDYVWQQNGSLLLPKRQWHATIIFRSLKQKAWMNICLSILVGWHLLLLSWVGVYLGIHGFALTESQLHRYQAFVSPVYAQAEKDLSFLRSTEKNNSDLKNSEMYVLGNPAYYLLTGKRQPVALQGWIPEMFLPTHWQQLQQQLSQAQPMYIYVLKTDEAYVIPSFQTWLSQTYSVVSQTPEGKWYRLRQVG
jgi:hypothetical protein